MKNLKMPLLILLFFETIAIFLWKTSGHVFFLFNFSYIGICLALGTFFFEKKWKYARNVVQFAIGSYMLIFLGVVAGENMQLEGFWYYLFLGVFQAAVIHYSIAKIFGPLLFGRGWCGYACWSAMIFDLLPYKIPQGERQKYGYFRYVFFALSFFYVALIFTFFKGNLEKIIYLSFIIGNIVYYGVGIFLAYKFKDNRAFCKYICPITVFLKPASYFSIMRIKVDNGKCTSCMKCKKVCPMEVDMIDPSRKRKNGTECILCMECIKNCKVGALKI